MLVAQPCPTLCDRIDRAHQAPLSIGFSRQEYWSELPFPPPGDLLHPGIEPGSLALQADSLPSEPIYKILMKGVPGGRAWQPTPIFLPGESQGQRSLAGCSPWGCKESETTEMTEATEHSSAQIYIVYTNQNLY